MISVIICTHNPDTQRLARVLEALRAQTLPPTQWELLLIDNASSAPVTPVLAWHPRARIMREPQLGLTPARLRGIAEAAGDVLVFVDDDNLLSPAYLAESEKIAATWPILGAWGGRIDPEFTSPPPEWTRQFWHLLALARVDAPRWSNATLGNHAVPPGAGQCVRRIVAERYAQLVNSHPLRRGLGRVGGVLTSGEDLDLALTSIEFGLGTGQFPELQLTHIIPDGRLTQSYFERLIEGVTYSTLVHDFIRHGRDPGSRPKSRARALFERWERSRQPARERAFAEASERAWPKAIATIENFRRTQTTPPKT